MQKLEKLNIFLKRLLPNKLRVQSLQKNQECQSFLSLTALKSYLFRE